jgi:hypothetical protein
MTELSQLTLKNLQALVNKFKTAGVDNPNDYLNYLKSIQEDTTPSTFRKYANNLNSLVKHNIIKVSPEQKELIKNFFIDTKEQFDKNFERKKRDPLEPTAEQELNTLRSKLDEIKEPNDRLLIALYVFIPPLRSDYADILIVKTDAEVDDPEQNYFVLDDNLLILNKYKRMNFKDNSPQETKVFDLAPIKKYIDASLKAYPRDFLFETKSLMPYNSNTFTKHVQAVFAKYFKKAYTINSLRHLYATAHKHLSTKEIEKIAAGMNHSYKTHIKLYEDR